MTKHALIVLAFHIMSNSIDSVNRTFTIDIKAVTDPAIITVPNATITGNQDATIFINGLSAILVDNVTDNGPEIISAIITGVPEGTIFSAGAQTGFGTWVIPVSELPNLEITPPEFFAGTMNLNLTAFTFESSTGEEVQVSAPFVVEIDPIPDTFLIVARNVVLDPSPSDLTFSDLELRMRDNRTVIEPLEIPNEYVEFTYAGLPTGVRLVPAAGGRLIDNGGGSYTFTGTPDQANQLFLQTGPGTLEQFDYPISVSGVSIDGGVTLSPAITDNFRLTVNADDTDSLSLSGPALLGGIGNDILTGDGTSSTVDGGAGNDLIIGGGGSDIMTGGLGNDMFQWAPADVDGSIDTILDFEIGTDIINVSEVLNGQIAYDPQFFDINDFFIFTDDGTDLILEFNPAIGLANNELVVLDGLGGVGTTLQDLFDNGSILL